jgi:hypothetical protein
MICVVVFWIMSRPQWPRGLRHEISSPAWTLGSWVRIPLEAWMFVCVCSVFVLSSVSSGLATGWSLVQGVLPTVYKCKITEPHKRRPRPDMGWSAIGWMDGFWIMTPYVDFKFSIIIPKAQASATFWAVYSPETLVHSYQSTKQYHNLEYHYVKLTILCEVINHYVVMHLLFITYLMSRGLKQLPEHITFK